MANIRNNFESKEQKPILRLLKTRKEDCSQLTIDKEFKELIPPLTEEEYGGLEESILNEDI